MVHPQCRGYVHRTTFIFNTLQNNSSDLRTQLQIFSTTQNYALSYRIFLPKPYAHSATEVVHALSWDLTLNPKIYLSFFASHHIITKIILDSFTSVPIYTSALLQYHGLKPWVPKNHGTFTKRGASTQPRIP